MVSKVQGGGFTFCCGECATMKRVDLVDYTRSTDVICDKCNKVTTVDVCFRKQLRKDTAIHGQLKIRSATQPVEITNMSLTGYRIKYMGIKQYSPRVDDIAVLTFDLPSRSQTPMRDTVMVMMKDSNEYGVKVTDLPAFSVQQRDKGFWLMS